MQESRVHVATSLAALVALCAAGPALAERHMVPKDQGMEARLFRPAVDTKGHFTVDSTPVLPHLAISLGMVLDFGFNDWVAVEQEGKLYDKTLIENYINSVFIFNLGLFDRFVIGLQVPLTVTSGEMYNPVDETTDKWSTSGGFGDLVIHVKAHLTRANRDLVGLGAAVQYQAPVGKPEMMVGDGGGGALSGKIIVDVEPASWYRAALNVGGRYPFAASENNTLDVDVAGGATPLLLFHYGPMVDAAIGQSFEVWPGLMDLVVEVYANQLATKFTSSAYRSLEVNAGFKIYVESNSFLMAGYAHGIPIAGTGSGYGFQNMEQRAFIGFAFEPSMADRDGDGIGDSEDQCPDEPEDKDGFEDSDGCPDPDNDRDGIPDVVDQCPLTPEDKDGDRDDDGCPESAEESAAESDRDKDRIPDDKDKCPDQPETYNGKDDKDGCPDEGDVQVTDGFIKVLKKINFEYNSDKIKKDSFKILDDVAATIIESPQIDLIEVQGHADERGNEMYNLRLTDSRAAAVLKYLVGKGVDRKRLRSVGYGEYCPVNPAHNEPAWEENRRVEFRVLSTNGTPTGVETACQRAKRKGIGAE
ncbi:MAG: OmpA family protein [Deltaproteobacteria bacterium]|nr:OmpA family protein [Deltaproteobacteria bacterium]